MSVLFTCPHCDAQTDVEDEYIGQTGPCFNCGRMVTVPYVPGTPSSPTGGTTTIRQTSTATRPQRDSPRAKSTSVFLTIVVIIGGLFASVVLIGMLVAVLFPAVRAAQAANSASTCRSNLERIGAALRAYHGRYDSFPPAFVTDDQGRPQHSWRVLLLPFLNEDALYNRYRFDEPWDGPNNINLLALMPAVYGCPDDPSSRDPFDTTYLVVLAAGTAFPGGQATSLEGITDLHGETILVVERHTSGISWLEPRDLPMDQMQFQIDSGPQDPAGRHDGTTNVLTVDGRARELTKRIASDHLRALFTVDGGELLPGGLFNADSD